MSTWDGNNHYFSGQGVVLIGRRDVNGKPTGLLPVGNVSDLKISIATTVVEHKESQTGQRGIDLRLVTETKASLSATLENYIAANLALALRGDWVHETTGTVTDEPLNVVPGLVSPLQFAMVSSVVINADMVALTLYDPDNPTTPWDYKLNAQAGSIMLNDGIEVAWAGAGALGAAITGVTVGTTTSLACVAPDVLAGYTVIASGLTGADAATLNGIPAVVVSNDGVNIVLAVDTTGKTITPGTGVLFGQGVVGTATADYSYEAQEHVNALTQGTKDYYVRFEGLNTADDLKPVIVEVFKFETDPTKESALIGDNIGQFVLEGSVLADPLQPTGSKYFKQTLLR